jgi:hypothetical protein
MISIETIHVSLLNGQRRQMVEQIKKYGLYDFWPDYRQYLKDVYCKRGDQYMYFADATVSYFRITER